MSEPVTVQTVDDHVRLVLPPPGPSVEFTPEQAVDLAGALLKHGISLIKSGKACVCAPAADIFADDEARN